MRGPFFLAKKGYEIDRNGSILAMNYRSPIAVQRSADTVNSPARHSDKECFAPRICTPKPRYSRRSRSESGARFAGIGDRFAGICSGLLHGQPALNSTSQFIFALWQGVVMVG